LRGEGATWDAKIAGCLRRVASEEAFKEAFNVLPKVDEKPGVARGSMKPFPRLVAEEVAE
jgi:hypothetical protein